MVGWGGQLGQSGFGDYLLRLPEGKPCTLVGIRQSWLLMDDLMNMGAGEGAEPLLRLFTMYKCRWPLGLWKKALCCHAVTEWGRTQHFNLLPKVSDLGVGNSSVEVQRGVSFMLRMLVIPGRAAAHGIHQNLCVDVCMLMSVL